MANDSRSRRRFPWPLVALLAVVVGGAAFAVLSGAGGAPAAAAPTWQVHRGPLRATVTEGGSLQSLKSTTVASTVEGETKILFVIPEGTMVTPEDVEAGRILVELESSQLEEKRRRQVITVSDVQAEVDKAREGLNIQRNQNESNLRTADLAVTFARIDLQKYLGADLATRVEAGEGVAASRDWRALAADPALGGESLQERRKFESDIDLAREELARAKDKLRWTEELLAKGFVSQDEQVADRLALKRQEVAVEQATTALDLFVRYEFPKSVERLASDLHEAKEAYLRTKRQTEAELNQAEADLSGKEERLKLESEEMQRYMDQIAACVIKATGPGLVVYATSEDRGNWMGEGSPIQQGASVRPRQAILSIPDPQSLGVRVNIHESVLNRVRPGQRASVTVDALPDKPLQGTVVKVATMPNTGNRWQNPDLKLYATDVALADAPPSLRPGMSARVEVLVEEVDSAVQVPIQAVGMLGRRPHVWVQRDGAFEARPVSLGLSTERFVEVLEGVAEGDTVHLAPPREAPSPGAPQGPEGAAPPAGGEEGRPAAGTRGTRGSRGGGPPSGAAGSGGGARGPGAGAGPRAAGPSPGSQQEGAGDAATGVPPTPPSRPRQP